MNKYTFTIFAYGLLLLFGAACSSLPDSGICLIPQVDHLEREKGTLPVRQLKHLYLPVAWRDAGIAFANDVEELAGLSLTVVASDSSAVPPLSGTAIRIVKAELEKPEAYALKIRKQDVLIEASDRAGMHRAFATLLQLLLHACTAPAGNGELPRLAIQDNPRFAYRGVMIDCSRHFWTIGQLKKEIRQLAFFKFNTLHLHLTDNQGWRLYLDRYPELAAKGSCYRDFPKLSGYYYRKDELKELVRYAAVYGVEIVPEVDLPGHCQALLAAMPELSCNGGTFEVYPEEQGGEGRKRGGENMLCIGNPAVYRFVEDLVEKLAEIFPSRYIHLGGDEVSTHIWEKCPRCRSLYRQQGMASWHTLQDYFTRQASGIVRSAGKTMVGWDEINDRDAAMPGDVVMVWQRDGREQLEKALGRGLPVFLSPKDPCYFDFGYSRNSTRRVYEWEPVPDGMTEGKEALVRGGQANLWTEFVTTVEELDRMLYPRACALAEALWSRPERKEWKEFRKRIESSGEIFRRLGIHAFMNDGGCLMEDDRDNPGFVPWTEQMPALACPAHIETNMDGVNYYLPEYAFDGDTCTFFSTPYSLEAGSYFTLILDEEQMLRRVEIVFDRSKEHPEQATLSISTDGTAFREIPALCADGRLSAAFGHPVPVKAVRMELPVPLMARLSIKEFLLK